MFSIADLNGDPAPSANTMSFAITFATPPVGTSVIIPKYKFNKKSHFAMEWDDGVMRWNNPVVKYLSSLHYTDGCGNPIGYSAAIAINSGTGRLGDEGYNPNFLQAAEIRNFINIGWDFSNHGMVHGPSPTAYDDTLRLDKLIKQRANYAFHTTVVPTDFSGYTKAAYDMGYLFATAQSDSTADAWRSVRVHEKMPLLNTEPVFIFVVRDFSDDWGNPEVVNWFKTEIDKFIDGRRDFERIGTHNDMRDAAHLKNFKTFMNYVQAATNDKTIVCSTREFMEYRQMALQPMSQRVSGNQLIITIDISKLSKRNRWRDLSFKVSGGTILSVKPISGIDAATFNTDKGLVNIFSQKTVW